MQFIEDTADDFEVNIPHLSVSPKSAKFGF